MNGFALQEFDLDSFIEREAEESVSSNLAVKWSELERREFAPLDFIIHETARGEVAQMTSATDIGKTTLLLNLTLSVCCGRELPPLVVGSRTPRRVLFCDFETRLSRLKHDIRRMTQKFTECERETVRENLSVMCDVFVDDEPLTLSNPLHLRQVELEAKEHRADVIIIDTLAGAFNLQSENDNAEAGRVVQKPFRRLAATTDALVLYSSHIGKASETGAARDARAYRMRGASAHGCFARSVFNLEPDAHDRERVTLACAKVKGAKFKDAVLRLNAETRWFELTDEQPTRIKSNYELVIDAMREAGKLLTRKEIEVALDGHVTRSSVGRSLDEGVRRGELLKQKHGVYELAANTQILTPIRNEYLSISPDSPAGDNDTLAFE